MKTKKNRNNANIQKHTHLQAAQSNCSIQSLQKSVLFSIPKKLKNKNFPSLQKNKTLLPHSPQQTDTNFNGGQLKTQHLPAFHRDMNDRKQKHWAVTACCQNWRFSG
ncbi:hypothetical protein [Schleiferia thermophila]|uniref:hypothetical protein n=1 Tax=Schleiferia thermophila TaxID=884107 RepID=UPI000F62680E|nr:hypothetical protein [Schleiferia thermophila]